MISITRQGYTFQTVLGSMDLIHMNGRVEDSFTGRFLSPDPHVPDPGNTQGYNRYGYVNNNPLTFVDPTGFYCGEPPATPAPDVLGLGYGGDPAGDSAPVEEVTVTSACVPFPTYDFPSPVISWPGIPSLPLPKPVSVAPEQSVNPCPPARLSPRGLHPRVQSMADQLLDDLSSQGLNGRLGQTLRTFAQQNQLYAQGRTVPGPIVTNAQGGQSIHNFGLAFDIQMFDPSGNYITNGSDPAYSTAGQIGQNLGLEWGGNWSSIFDPSHFQYTGGLTLAQILANYNAGVDPLCHTQ
jgi:RHS repeat-associated protein